MTNAAIAFTVWALLAAGFWTADAIAQFKADRIREMRERNK